MNELDLRTLLLPFLLALSACGGGGGGGGSLLTVIVEVEPNDTTAAAGVLALGRPGTGDLSTAGDVDYWAISVSAGTIVQLELFAVRFDQAGWESDGNVPRLTLLAPDGVSKLLEHDYTGNFSDGWFWGAHDLDMPCFRVPASGTYFVCVTQDDQALAGGLYAVRASAISLGSIQVEAEAEATTGANDSFGTAQAIVPGTLRGFHVDDEDDWYAFTVPGPSLVTFEMRSYRNGVFGGDDNYFDPEITLYDADGMTVLDNNDDVFFYDSAIHYLLSAAGTYYLKVEECCGLGDARYFLLFGRTVLGATPESEPNDAFGTADPIAYGTIATGSMDAGLVDFFKFVGTAGDMVRVELFDATNADGSADGVGIDFLDTDGATILASDGFGDLQFLNTILPATGTYYVRISPDGSPLPTDYAFQLTRFKSSGLESEPNDTRLAADLLDAGGRASGAIEPAADVDVFKFLGNAQRLVTIVIYADDSFTGSDGFYDFAGHGSDLDPVLTVKDGAGATLATSTCDAVFAYTEGVVDGLPTAQVSFVPASTATYFVEVSDAFGTGSRTNTYVIEKK